MNSEIHGLHGEIKTCKEYVKHIQALESLERPRFEAIKARLGGDWVGIPNRKKYTTRLAHNLRYKERKLLRFEKETKRLSTQALSAEKTIEALEAAALEAQKEQAEKEQVANALGVPAESISIIKLD